MRRSQPTGGRRRSDAVDALLDREAIVVVDREGRVADWSEGAARLFGWVRDEAMGRCFADLTSLEPAGPPASGKDAGAAEPAVAVTRSGGRLDLESRWSPADPDDVAAERAWIGRDVTAARADERRLQASDDRYRWLFQAMDAAFWHLDFRAVGRRLREKRAEGVTDFRAYFETRPDFVDQLMRETRVIDINDRTRRLFGEAPRGETGDLGSVAPYWPEDSRSIFSGAVLAALGGQSVYVRETVLQSLDGRRFDALFTACLPPDGVAEGVLLIGVVDISARVSAQRALEVSEARQRRLVHHLPIPLVQLDLKPLMMLLDERGGSTVDLRAAVAEDAAFALEIARSVRIIDANAEARRLMGASDADTLDGRDIAFAWRTRPETLRRSLLARLEGRSTYTEETQIDTLDGRVVDVLYSIAFEPALVDQGVNVVGFVDISERLATQRSIARLESELAHAGRVAMLGELTASIAHEVNQPLAAIATNAATGLRWLDRPQPELGELREITRNIVADAHRAANTIQRIRAMASGGRIEHERMDLSDLIRDVLRFLAHEGRSRSVALEGRTPARPVEITGDRTQIQQVLVNLVMNGLQALDQIDRPDRRVTLSVGAEDGAAEVIVCDTGPGLPPEVRDHLFEAFFTTKPNGMGMGLAICRSIVEAHGGTISVAEPVSGESGAAFRISLPLARPRRASSHALA